MELKLRPVRPEDYGGISRLEGQLLAAHRAHRPDFFEETDEAYPMDEFQSLLEDKKAFGVVAVAGEKITGFCAVKLKEVKTAAYLTPHSYAFINDICVDETCQRQGIGKQLFEYAVKEAKKRGMSCVRLNVWEFNQGAIGFYHALGMEDQYRQMELAF
ncbi:MAG: GNAT family N-acetyltransferase [Oscillospiraceae bacterium]|nr:GNAT family N-acetyltransferase [Oscillospiraceae bacterium]